MRRGRTPAHGQSRFSGRVRVRRRRQLGADLRKDFAGRSNVTCNSRTVTTLRLRQPIGVLADLPDLERADIRACLSFAADRERRFVSVPIA